MVLSDRQKDILQKAVFEYIDQAQPVSSRWLEERYELEVSPATIRNELLFLTDEGFLLQPHTSAGRVPTDKGYRFFVDEVSQHGKDIDEQIFAEQDLEEQDVRDYFHFIQLIVKNLAEASSNLIIAYVPARNLFWKEGWEGVLKAPEFGIKEHILHFTNFLGDLEKGIQKFHARKILDIYIGKENPFSKERDFSIMISAYPVSDNENGMIAIAGPKRMAYEKNIGLMNSLHKIFVPLEDRKFQENGIHEN